MVPEMPKKKVERRVHNMDENSNGKPIPDTYWAPTLKYDESFHPDEVIKIAESGKWLSAIVAAFKVSEDTLYDWRERYPRFAEAWRVGYHIARQTMEEQMAEAALDPNYKGGLNFLYNVRFKPHAVKVRRINKAKTAVDAHKCVGDEMVDGTLDPNQLTAALKFVDTKVAVEESSKQDARIAALEQAQGMIYEPIESQS